MNVPKTPTDGPDAALARLARVLKLPYSRGHVTRAVAAHPRPNSLLALVDVATDLGLKTTPGKSDVSSLAELQLPLIVHFAAGDTGGFGVLEAVAPDGFHVWDSVNGLQVFDRDLFLRDWSGIVALVERDETRRTREKGFLRHRILELIAGDVDPPEIAGGRGARTVRVALAAIVAALVAAAIVDLPPDDRVAGTAIIVLSALGLAVTITMAVAIADYAGPFSPGMCRRGKFVDCESVLTSRFSRIAGIPLSDIGIAFYGSILLLLATEALSPEYSSAWLVAGSAYAASIPFSLALIGVQIGMKRVCTLCLGAHAVNMVSAAIFWLSLRREEWSVGRAASSSLLVTLLFFLILFFVIPYFKKSQTLSRVARIQAQMSRSPFAALAQLATEPATDIRGASCGVALDGPAAVHELVVFAHPSCSQCEPVLREARLLAAAGRTNVFVAMAPKDPDDSDRRVCSVVLAVGLSTGPDRMLQAFAAAKWQWHRLLGQDQVPRLTAELDVSMTEVEPALEQARRLVEESERQARAHVEGTPALFFDGRSYRGTVTDLAFLLQHHVELLRFDSDPRASDRARDLEETAPA